MCSSDLLKLRVMAGSRFSQGDQADQRCMSWISAKILSDGALIAIDRLIVNDAGRVIAFRRSSGLNELLVVASWSNDPFASYVIETDPGRLSDGAWRELFNSDAAIYGGRGVGNLGADLVAHAGRLALCLPATALVVFQKL